MKAIRAAEWYGQDLPAIKVSPHGPGGIG